MSQDLGVYIFDEPGGKLIADWTYRSRGGVITTNERGFESYNDIIPMSVDDAFRFYDQPLRHVVVKGGGGVAFEGRLEDRSIVPGGLGIVAFGYQRALSDLPYTCLWSDDSYGRWRPVTDDERSTSTPEKYEMDNNNRVYITAKLDETIGNAVDRAEFTYAAPHLGRRGISAFDCSYTFDFPNNWQFRIISCDYDYTNTTVENTITSSGSPLSGSLNLTFTAKDRIFMQVRNNTGSAQTIAADTGDNYLRLTGVVVRTQAAAPHADDVAIDLADFVMT